MIDKPEGEYDEEWPHYLQLWMQGVTEWCRPKPPTHGVAPRRHKRTTKEKRQQRKQTEDDDFDRVCGELRREWNHTNMAEHVELATLESRNIQQSIRSDAALEKQSSSGENLAGFTEEEQDSSMQNELLRTELIVNDTKARVLIDAGATHNIVTTSFCAAANIRLDRRMMRKQAVTTLLDGKSEVEGYSHENIV